MNFRCLAGSAIAFILLTSQHGWAESKRELAWSQIGSIQGKRVRVVVMPGGALLEGIASRVEPECLILEVRNTKGSTAHSTGLQTLPRTALKQLQVEDYHVRWRVTGTAVGLVLSLGAAAAGMYAASGQGLYSRKERRVGVGLGLFALAAALPVGGYFLGKKADRHWTTVSILP